MLIGTPPRRSAGRSRAHASWRGSRPTSAGRSRCPKRARSCAADSSIGTSDFLALVRRTVYPYPESPYRKLLEIAGCGYDGPRPARDEGRPRRDAPGPVPRGGLSDGRGVQGPPADHPRRRDHRRHSRPMPEPEPGRASPGCRAAAAAGRARRPSRRSSTSGTRRSTSASCSTGEGGPGVSPIGMCRAAASRPCSRRASAARPPPGGSRPWILAIRGSTPGIAGARGRYAGAASSPAGLCRGRSTCPWTIRFRSRGGCATCCGRADSRSSSGTRAPSWGCARPPAPPASRSPGRSSPWTASRSPGRGWTSSGGAAPTASRPMPPARPVGRATGASVRWKSTRSISRAISTRSCSRAGGARPGLPPDALLISSIRPSTAFILLNVAMGDQAVVSERACGCPYEQLGWTTHLHWHPELREADRRGHDVPGHRRDPRARGGVARAFRRDSLRLSARRGGGPGRRAAHPAPRPPPRGTAARWTSWRRRSSPRSAAGRAPSGS